MTVETLLRTDLWRNFEQRARAARKQPAAVLANLLREYLEVAEDVELNDAMRRDARKTGYTEAEAVKLVSEHRTTKRKHRAAS
jgi:hypothetical protein